MTGGAEPATPRCQTGPSVERLDDESVLFARGSQLLILEADLGPAEIRIPPPSRSAGYLYPLRVVSVLLDSPAFDPPTAVRDYNNGPPRPPGRYLVLMSEGPIFSAEKIEPGSPRVAEVRDLIAKSKEAGASLE